MAALLNFNAASVPPAEALEAIPAGWYTVQMTGSEMKPTSQNDGSYLQCEFTVLAPAEYAGRKLFDRINLQNKNPTAVEIGYRTLSAICHSVGVIQVQDSQMLHGRPLQAKVSLRPAGPGANGQHYDASNEIRGYKAVDGVAPGMGMPGAPAATPDWAGQQQFQPQQAPQFAPPPAAAPQFQPQQPQFQPPAAAPAPAPAAPPWGAAPNAGTAGPGSMPGMNAPAQGHQPAQATPPWSNPAPAAPAPVAAPVPPWMQGQPQQA